MRSRPDAYIILQLGDNDTPPARARLPAWLPVEGGSHRRRQCLTLSLGPAAAAARAVAVGGRLGNTWSSSPSELTSKTDRDRDPTPVIYDGLWFAIAIDFAKVVSPLLRQAGRSPVRRRVTSGD